MYLTQGLHRAIQRDPNVMLGYWNRPIETAVAIRDGRMHTGDGAYLDQDGFVFVVDRIKDMIMTGSENVFSVEMENAIMQHPSHVAYAVVGTPNAQWSESAHAVVVLKPDAQATEEELQAHCKKLIAGFKFPRSIEFRASLPLSGAGKILKTALREPFWKDRARAMS